MRTVWIQPENGGKFGFTGTVNSKLDPVLDRGIFRLTSPPNIALFHVVRHQYSPMLIYDANGAVRGQLKGLVV